ncbi:MAG: amino acid ABC transporter permease [Burkholderiales bacterium]|nr:amino acid ABC transporter permease [Burkholderiales bacterium]
MSFDWSPILAQLPDLFRSAGMTFLIWLCGALGAVVLGFGVALGARYGPRALGFVLRLCVEVIRGTPFLIQLFLLYYGGPFIGLSLEPVPAGLLGLTVYGAAYFSEIFRAGFEAVPPGHVQAAECLGLSPLQIVVRIFIPEMTMLVLPPGVNMAIVLLKETAVLSIITVPELTFEMQAIGSQQYAFVEAMFVLACFYWALVELSGRLGRLAESRLSRYRFATT